ncbi:MAG: HD domain-containing protein [Oscillospiraceae bacterium]|jgi:putative nucleotidyltransferase with HDIG domain|nr:HD domain-containing protein [Oscillospiraceae bacterium]
MNQLKEQYQELERHLLRDETPSCYLNEICDTPVFQKNPFDLLNRLRQTKQSPKYHPEGSVWNHTLLVVDEAAKRKGKSKDTKVFLWAALLHDVGKPAATRMRRGRITSYDHEKIGKELAENFLRTFTQDDRFIQAVTALVRWHMQPLFLVYDLPYADVEAMKRQTDLYEVALLGLCDRMGRLHADREKEEHNMELFLRKCEKD